MKYVENSGEVVRVLSVDSHSSDDACTVVSVCDSLVGLGVTSAVGVGVGVGTEGVGAVAPGVDTPEGAVEVHPSTPRLVLKYELSNVNQLAVQLQPPAMPTPGFPSGRATQASRVYSVVV